MNLCRLWHLSAALAAAFLLLGQAAWAQAITQSGPILNGGGHVPMYLGGSTGSSLASVMDSGPASGGANGYGLSELLLQQRTTGTGPYGTNDCDWSTYATNPAGPIYLCRGFTTSGVPEFATNQSGLNFIIGGNTYQFPASLGGIAGPASTKISDVPVFNNAVGSLLADPGTVGILSGDLLVGSALNPTNNYLVNAIPNTTNISQFASLSTTGAGFGSLGAVQTLNTNAGVNASDGFGVGGFALVNDASGNHSGWGLFGQVRMYSPTTAVGQAQELDAINISAGTPLALSPYGTYGNLGTAPYLIGEQLACGDPAAGAVGDCSSAINILNNSAAPSDTEGKFLDGIVFAANAIKGASGVDTDTTPVQAIELGRMQSLSFWSLGSGNANPTVPAAQIYGSTTATGGATSMNLNFGSVGAIIEDAFTRSKNAVFAVFNNATSYLQFTAGTVAFPPNIQVKGTDANIGLAFSVPGTGGFSFYDAAGNTNLIDIVGAGQLFYPAFNTPVSSSAACITGTQEVDANYLYVCVATNTWKRATLSSF